MFGLKIVNKEYFEELEDRVRHYENTRDRNRITLNRVLSGVKGILDNSKKLTKTEIVNKLETISKDGRII